jgi:hypothetical protein
MFQWMYPSADVMIMGAVMLINEKPQGLMYEDPCTGPATKNYNSAPIYFRFDYFRSYIISGAESNVDIQ